jgi:hypothetical protein
VFRVQIHVDPHAPVSAPEPEIAAAIRDSYQSFTVPQLLWLLGSLSQEWLRRGVDLSGVRPS